MSSNKIHVYSSKHYIAEPSNVQEEVFLTYDDGYKSHVPMDVFDRDFRASGALTFGDALVALKSGKRVSRLGWNGKGMWLVLVPGTNGLVVDEGRPLAKAGLAVGTKFNYLPHIDMFTAQGDLVPWLASQTDVLAEDWCVLDQD